MSTYTCIGYMCTRYMFEYLLVSGQEQGQGGSVGGGKCRGRGKSVSVGVERVRGRGTSKEWGQGWGSGTSRCAPHAPNNNSI